METARKLNIWTPDHGVRAAFSHAESRGAVLSGSEGALVEVEVSIEPEGRSAFLISGLAQKEVSESRLRIRAAMSASKLHWPKGRIVCNLGPGDIKKGGTSLDLPIAVAIAMASGQCSPIPVRKESLLIGELKLNGRIAGLPGALALGGTMEDRSYFVVPMENLRESTLIRVEKPGVRVLGAENLRQVLRWLEGAGELETHRNKLVFKSAQVPTDFSNILGHDDAKMAMEIAAAGSHHILVCGPPGCLAGDTPIYDPVSGENKTVSERHLDGKGFNIESFDHKTGINVIAKAMPVQKFEEKPILKVCLSNGKQIRVTGDHLFWDGRRWISAFSASGQLQECGPIPLPTNSAFFQQDHQQDDLHLKRKEQDSTVDYSTDHHPCDEQLHFQEDDGQLEIPLPSGAHEHNLFLNVGVLAHEPKHNPIYRDFDHLSKMDFCHQQHSTQAFGAKHLPPQAFVEQCAFPDGAVLQLNESEQMTDKEKSLNQYLPQTMDESLTFFLDRGQNHEVFLSQSDVTQKACCKFVAPEGQNQRDQLHPVCDLGSTDTEYGCHLTATTSLPGGDRHEGDSQFSGSSHLASTSKLPTSLFQDQVEQPSSLPQRLKKQDIVFITKIEDDGNECYFDFHVPGYNCYWAAGVLHHNTGKSMLAKALPGIMPPMSNEEIVQCTRIWSIRGDLQDGEVVRHRPFRSPHFSISKSGLIGGGSGVAVPGEISLAHLGVLFLDELTEFPRSLLESLRTPLEDGKVTISRVGESMQFPSRFQLIAATNLCPCGLHPLPQCSCSGKEVARYQSKISGPLLDRFDLKVAVNRLKGADRFKRRASECSRTVRGRVVRARKLQWDRYGSRVKTNADLTAGELWDHCPMDRKSMNLLKRETSDVSMRSMHRVVKVSRTVADLRGHNTIQEADMRDALSLCTPPRSIVSGKLA